MNNQTLKNNILEEIQKEDLKPKPKWHFLLKSFVVWVLAIISFFVGSVATSVLIFNIVNHKEMSGGIVSVMPVVWLVLLLVFAFASYYNYKHTKRGYRYNFWIIFSISILASLIFGIGLFTIKVGSHVDQELGSMMKYETVEKRVKEYWDRPSEGFLSGEILVLEKNGDFTLRDFNEKEWSILAEDFSQEFPNVVKYLHRVRIVGKETGHKTFVACIILPLRPVGQSDSEIPDVYQMLMLEGVDLEMYSSPRKLESLEKQITQGERNIIHLRNKMCSDDQR